MAEVSYEHRRLAATLIFDVEDRYARERGVRGPHPRPVGRLRFFLLSEETGGGSPGRLEPPRLLTVVNPGGYHLFFDAVELANGSRRRLPLAPGTHAIRVESELYQPFEAGDVLVPMPVGTDDGFAVPRPYFIDLEPGYAYPFPEATVPGRGRGPTLLRGALLAPSGAGIAGASVAADGAAGTYRTDESGQWVLELPDLEATAQVTVTFALPGGTSVEAPGVSVEAGRTSSLPQTAFTGRVLDEVGAGVAGAAVTVLDHPGETRSRSDGSWRYHFGADQAQTTVRVRAVYPNGRRRTRSGVRVHPRQTRVVPDFRL